MKYTFTVYLALFGWAPLTFLFFTFFPARRAALIAILGGHMFLPMAGIPIAGLPDYTKVSAVSASVILAIMLFDGKSLTAFRMRWFDLPMVLWCVWPFLSSVSSGAGVYAGLSAVLNQIFMWGIPYLVGRIYFSERESLRELLLFACAAGLIYAPLCLFEARMAPVLHKTVYNFNQHVFAQTKRFGGFRPQVFMAHGLAIGMFMTSVSLVAIGLWLGRSRERVFTLSIGWSAVILGVTTILCKSLGSLLLGIAGLAALMMTGRGRTLWPAYMVLLMAPSIIFLRTTGVLETETVTGAARALLEDSRVSSLETRLITEDTLLTKCKEKLMLGWGPGAAFRDDIDGTGLVSATDGFWIITFGKFGLGSLMAFLGCFVVPGIVALRWSRRRRVTRPDQYLYVPILTTLVGLYLVDSILNAMPNPLFLIIAGALGAASMRTDAGVARAPVMRRRVAHHVRG